MADVYEQDNPSWYHHYQLVKQESGALDVIEHLQLIFIELPKFPIHSPDEKQLRLLWLRFLREINEKTVQVSQDLLDVPEISEAVVLSQEATYTPTELESYDAYWDSISTEKTLLLGKYEEGLAEGEAKGLVKGLQLMATNMLIANEPLDKISQFTGLSISDIEALKSNL